ncbi:(2E,6E)-farnesyl diphosphate synthase [Catenovulum sp. SM1970]|uniref:(2E,6E)-farnesyl diphosphate synthase n=1 Tax=Marinifaba aquimaris TaxID=2741323 RepID=UPI00157190D2|nr:(2E,6E)-farnesyl diphosphate synthase [Marinifaba aquimaris]
MLKTKLAEFQQRTESELANSLANIEAPQADRLFKAMEYSLMNGGKRVRPFLIYATGEMLGIDLNQLDPIACAIEMIHSYSLVHDDLPAMDDDNLRRGKPTCHIEFDDAEAILAGDALQSLAFEQIADAKVSSDIKVAWLKNLSSAAGLKGMCGGQSLDLAAEHQHVDLNSLETIHKLKTGALLQSSIALAYLAKPDIAVEHAKALDDFAYNIGLAFQVQDDILDITSTTEELGKPQGSDQKLEKSTYPALLGLQGAQEKAHSLYQSGLEALDSLPYNTELLAEFAAYIINRKY